MERTHPDYLLAEVESASRLNEQLFAAEPHEYFSWRLYLLALAGDPSKDLASFARDGIDFAGFKIGPTDDITVSPEEVERRRNFAMAESVVLLHHVGETLLRLYFANVELPPSPWLAIARERNFARFKRRVRERFIDGMPTDDHYAKTARLFFGTEDPTKITPQPEQAQFDESVRNIDRWLRFFSRAFLDEANVYNALKHGLAVNAGESEVRVDDGSVLSAAGPSLLYLAERETDKRRVWALTTRWVDLGQTMASIWIGIKFIESLWQISQARYTKSFPESIHVFTGPPFDDFLKAQREGIILTTMAWDLTYYVESEHASR